MSYSTGHCCLSGIVLFFFSVSPPDKAECSNQEVRGGQHIKDAGIEAFPFGAAVFQIAFSGHSAHGALGISGGSNPKYGSQEDK
jgi:hypothetical protein